MRRDFFKLMLVTNKGSRSNKQYLKFITKCVEAGVTSVQLREKQLSFDKLYTFAKELQEILKGTDVPLIINDSVNLAYEINADGVHLGQSDGDILEARQKLGEQKIIGFTVNTNEQLTISNNLPINYVGIGAIFKTKNKLDAPMIWECEGLKRVSPLSRFPIVAIGGIDESNAAQVMASGADGIAAIGAFDDAKDPAEATKILRKIVDGGI